MSSIVKKIEKRYKKKLQKRMINKLGDNPISRRAKKMLENFEKYKKDFHRKWSKTKKGGRRRRKSRRKKTRKKKRK